MSRLHRIVSLFTVVVFLLGSVLPALAASDYEDAMEKSMYEALVKTGMQGKKATSVAQQYVFIGTVMLNNVQKQLLEDQQDKLFAQAGKVGSALGHALGHAFRVYGDKKNAGDGSSHDACRPCWRTSRDSLRNVRRSRAERICVRRDGADYPRGVRGREVSETR